MCPHDHLHALKLSTRQGHHSVGKLHFAHLLLFRWLTKTAWNFLLGWGSRIRCLVGTSLFLFFVHTVGVQSNHIDPVIIRIHVKTLMLVCGLLVVLLDCGKEIDFVVFSPCCWRQLLKKHCYSYFHVRFLVFVTMAKVTQHGVGNIQCIYLIQRVWLTDAMYEWSWFL